MNFAKKCVYKVDLMVVYKSINVAGILVSLLVWVTVLKSIRVHLVPAEVKWFIIIH